MFMTEPNFLSDEEFDKTLFPSFTKPSYTENEIIEFVKNKGNVNFSSVGNNVYTVPWEADESGTKYIDTDKKEINISSTNTPRDFIAKMNSVKNMSILGQLSSKGWINTKTNELWRCHGKCINKEQLARTGLIWRVYNIVHNSLMSNYRRMDYDDSHTKGIQDWAAGQLLTPHVSFYVEKGIAIMMVFQTLSTYEVIILNTPTCKFDDRYRFHSIKQAAIEWDILQEYYIHGVKFDQELWYSVSNRMLKPKDVFAISNIEQRRVATEHYGMESLWNECKPKLFNTSDRGSKNKEGEFIPNQLYKLKIGELSWQDRHEDRDYNALMLRYKDPSTDRIYISGIPHEDDNGNSIETADHAMAWKFHLTEEQYKTLTVEG